ncbi:MAG: SGNH/GDSL hydrolase family protein [Chloroflexi bacterium]|nr:SGNH/GDSL hydrolase family protein [Chloroflexota bacterium]
MRRKVFANALIVVFAVALTLVLLEVLVRVAGATDADGRFTLLNFTLDSPKLPVNELRGQVEGYIANKDIAVVVYDEWTGWSFRPNSVRQDGTFTINGAGFRSRRDFDQSPPADTLRIAVFGDSFTAGDDVGDGETWAYLLERALNEAGIRAEVLNFGVGAYGMGQAYLRWQRLGKSFSPDIVIFGLQPENLKRNVNVFRQLLHRSGPAFSKPRFALVEDELQLLNVPTLPPEQLMEVFENFSDHPLAPYEFYYKSRFTAARWWAASRLFSLVFEALRQAEDEPDIYRPGSEGGELGKAIIDAFAQDVREAGSEFVVLHLPLQSHLIRYFSNLPRPRPVYDFLLEHCRESYHYIALEEHLEPAHVDDKYWSPTKHYGPPLHALLAEVAASAISSCIENGDCRTPRFPDSRAYRAGEATEDG